MLFLLVLESVLIKKEMQNFIREPICKKSSRQKNYDPISRCFLKALNNTDVIKFKKILTLIIPLGLLLY